MNQSKIQNHEMTQLTYVTCTVLLCHHDIRALCVSMVSLLCSSGGPVMQSEIYTTKDTTLENVQSCLIFLQRWSEILFYVLAEKDNCRFGPLTLPFKTDSKDLLMACVNRNNHMFIWVPRKYDMSLFKADNAVKKQLLFLIEKQHM